MITLLDLDGVCADFYSGAARLAGVPSIATAENRRKGPSIRCSYDLGKTLGAGIWGNIRIEGARFWSNLEPLPWLDELVDIVEGRSEEVYVCSSPGGQLAGGSVPGKMEWCRKHLPGIPQRNLIFTGHKHLLAAPDRLLIDDSDDMLDRFDEAGGLTWCMPQPWNESFSDTVFPVTALLREFLDGDMR